MSDLRASDADRERAAARLKVALDEGRLDLTEYDDRLQRAYAARTYSDLDALFVDLPQPVPAQYAQVAPTGAVRAGGAPVGRQGHRDWATGAVGSWLMVSAICTVIWLLGDARGDFWPKWVIVPWGLFVLLGLLRGPRQHRRGDRHGCP